MGELLRDKEPNQQDLPPSELFMHGRISQAPMGAAVGPAVQISTADWGKHGATAAPRGRSNMRGMPFACTFYVLKKRR